jgi:signal transduction histidine kinase
MKNDSNVKAVTATFSTDQLYVQKFTFIYCCVILVFSAYFTPQDFNLRIAVIVNILFFLIGAPYWFRKTRIPSFYLNIISQISNGLASVWTCSFLGPSSHINLVAIPQFVLVLMMFDKKPKIKIFLGVVCLILLLLPLFPFVNEVYIDKRMKESNLSILRSLIDICVLTLTTFQFKVIVENWRDALGRVKEEKSKVLEESIWREKLLKVLSHDIKEPMVYTLQYLRKLRRRIDNEQDLLLLNQVENAQMVIREVISNIESYSSSTIEAEIPKDWISLEEVLEKTLPWIKSRLDEKSIQIKIKNGNEGAKFYINIDSFLYQVFNNLITNAIKFSPRGSIIELEQLKLENNNTRWIIRDFGKGISSHALSDSLFSELGSEGEIGSGLGIKIAKIFANKQNVEISWHSKFINRDSQFVGTEIYLDQKAST